MHGINCGSLGLLEALSISRVSCLQAGQEETWKIGIRYGLTVVGLAGFNVGSTLLLQVVLQESCLMVSVKTEKWPKRRITSHLGKERELGP